MTTKIALSTLMLLTFSFASSFAQRYLFSLHGKIVEDQGKKAYNPEYGPYRYEDICNEFRKAGFTVFMEYRQPNTDVKAYAQKITSQVDSLLHLGIRPGCITVLGASKGALIAMYISSMVKNPGINFIFLSSCNDYVLNDLPEINFCGNILSVYEKSDPGNQSCDRIKNRSNLKVSHFKELELNTGLKHGYLYKPLPEWVQPAIKWANEKYDLR